MNAAENAEIHRLVHELQAHQLELEAQNCELTSTRAALQASLERYIELYDFLPVGYLTVSRTGEIVELNLSAARLLGQDRRALVGAKLSRFLAGGSRSLLQGCVERAVRERADTEMELELRRRQGASRWLRVECTPDITRDGCRLVLQDVTDRRRNETELRRTDRLKTEFLAMLGHELRNPLLPIRNAAHVLGRLCGEVPDATWAHGVIERQIQHLTRIVDDLLDASRIARGQMQVELAPVALGEVVTRALETARLFLEAKSQRLEVEIQEDPLVVKGDAVRLTQVVVNLLHNASKYSEPGSAMSLEVSSEGRNARLRVQDASVGIDPMLQPYVCDLFVQSDRSLDRAEGGLGVGLALVRHVVGLHGGRLELESPGQGGGTTVSVWLPLERMR